MSQKKRHSLINLLSSPLFDDMDQQTQTAINKKIKKLKQFIHTASTSNEQEDTDTYTASLDLPDWVITQQLDDDSNEDTTCDASSTKFNSVAQLETFSFADVDTDQSSCLICMDNFTQKSIVRQLPCRHIFCDKCILQWFDHSSQCPKCRGPI